MKNKKRGVALLSVIVLMSVVICFTLLMTAFVIGSSLTVRYQTSMLSNQVEILKLKNDFV